MKPLKMNPVFKNRIWGGNKLSRHFKQMDENSQNVGECWTLSAHPEGYTTFALDGMRNETINGLMQHEALGNIYFGGQLSKMEGQFPILVKVIDAGDILSLQVHPNDYFAQIHENQQGKNEMWYILEADPDSEIILGFNQDVTKEQVRNLILENRLHEVLNRIKVRPGDFVYVEAGTIHAIGKGITVLEIQQSSDITYRLYDWGRVDSAGQTRDLHIEKALNVLKCNKEVRTELENYALRSTCSQKVTMLTNDSFKVSIVDVASERYFDKDATFQIVTCVSGRLCCKIGAETQDFQFGESILLPAECKCYQLIGTGTVVTAEWSK